MEVDFASRRRNAFARAVEVGADWLLVTSSVHVRYLCGFTGSNGALALHDGAATLATDGRYLEQAAGQCPDVELLDARDCAAGLLADRTGAVAFEDIAVSVAEHRRLAELTDARLIPIGGRLADMRRTKDAAEIRALREACQVTDAAFARLLNQLSVGWSERTVARALEAAMFDLGAEALAFDTIVAAGPNGSRPHHAPTDRPIGAGEFVTCDFGARIDGYHADMTRTVIVGGPVSAWQEDVYQLVRSSQRLARQAVLPGITLTDLDAAARAPIVAAGFGEQYPHGLGHGVGLEIHEAPLIGASATGTLPEQSVITIEPGVYLPGIGGVRIEDTLVVTTTGPDLLTTSSKELLVV